MFTISIILVLAIIIFIEIQPIRKVATNSTKHYMVNISKAYASVIDELIE